MTNPHHPGGRRLLHKDWHVWAGVTLMPAAIAIYVPGRDDSLLR